MSMLHQHFVTRLLLTTFYPFRKSLFIGFFNVCKYSGRYIIYMYARVEGVRDEDICGEKLKEMGIFVGRD